MKWHRSSSSLALLACYLTERVTGEDLCVLCCDAQRRAAPPTGRCSLLRLCVASSSVRRRGETDWTREGVGCLEQVAEGSWSVDQLDGKFSLSLLEWL